MKSPDEKREADRIRHKANRAKRAVAVWTGQEPWHGTYSGYDYHSCRCVGCVAAAAERQAAKPPISPQDRWRYNLKHRYGMTPFDFADMYSKQRGCCACCGEHPSSNYRMSIVCDSNRKPLGLMCRSCATAVKMLGGTREGALRLASWWQVVSST
ncbi:MAG: hypothetical protein ABJB05_11375 [Parafilimonas sp.]